MIMGNTLQRIKDFIDSKSLSNRAFETSVGLSNGSFSSQLKHNKTIGVDKIENILHEYPELNPTWLLKGTGSMLLSEISTQESTPETSINENDKDAIIKYQEKLIFKLQESKDQYEDRLKFVETMVEALRLKAKVDMEITETKKEIAKEKSNSERTEQS